MSLYSGLLIIQEKSPKRPGPVNENGVISIFEVFGCMGGGDRWIIFVFAVFGCMGAGDRWIIFVFGTCCMEAGERWIIFVFGVGCMGEGDRWIIVVCEMCCMEAGDFWVMFGCGVGGGMCFWVLRDVSILVILEARVLVDDVSTTGKW